MKGERLKKIPGIILAGWIALLSAVPFAAAEQVDPSVIRWDFSESRLNRKGIPDNWVYKGKMGTPDVKYDLIPDADTGGKVLKITADRASGVILRELKGIDLKKYPWIRWRWKSDKLPAGADARIKAKDDQGIALYIGYGRFSQKSISYTWETLTPKNSFGKAQYTGIVTVYWTCLRNQLDRMGKWHTEQQNLWLDLQKKLGKIPDKLGLSISSNSQYTDSESVCYLDFIEFRKEPYREDDLPDMMKNR